MYKRNGRYLDIQRKFLIIFYLFNMGFVYASLENVISRFADILK